jgi:hypothetical protein
MSSIALRRINGGRDSRSSKHRLSTNLRNRWYFGHLHLFRQPEVDGLLLASYPKGSGEGLRDPARSHRGRPHVAKSDWNL